MLFCMLRSHEITFLQHLTRNRGERATSQSAAIET